MGIAGRFAAPGNQTIENLAHLKADQIVGEWRDSTYGMSKSHRICHLLCVFAFIVCMIHLLYLTASAIVVRFACGLKCTPLIDRTLGIGGGRIPYDVNTGLVPAALRSIAALSRTGIYSNHSDWGTLADTYAQVWEDETLQFFQVTVPAAEARARVQKYVQDSSFAGPNQTNLIDSEVVFHALALNGYNNLAQVQVMNTDDCFRLFLVNSTNQTQLTSFVNQTANNVMRTFPAGLITSIGLLIANPAYGGDPVYAANFTANAYHGTVVWSWQQAMMARGLELQLDRCNSNAVPDFCGDAVVHGNVLKAYNALWDVIEANNVNLATEVWSWIYTNGDFQFTPLGALPPPPGTSATGK